MPLVAKCSVCRLFIVIWNCFGFCLAVLAGFIWFTVDPKLQQTDQTRFDTLSSPITHSVLWTTISSMSHLPMFSSLRLWFPVYDMILWVWFQRNLLHVFFLCFSSDSPRPNNLWATLCCFSGLSTSSLFKTTSKGNVWIFRQVRIPWELLFMVKYDLLI